MADPQPDPEAEAPPPPEAPPAPAAPKEKPKRKARRRRSRTKGKRRKSKSRPRSRGKKKPKSAATSKEAAKEDPAVKSSAVKSKVKSGIAGKSGGGAGSKTAEGKSGKGALANMKSAKMKTVKGGAPPPGTAPAELNKSGKYVDPTKNNAPLNEDEKTRKIEKNKQAIDQIIGMLRNIPPDNISNETKNDLIRIHAIVRGIQVRYVREKAENEKLKLDGMLQDLNEGKQVDADYLMKTAPGMKPGCVEVNFPDATSSGADKNAVPPSAKGTNPVKSGTNPLDGKSGGSKAIQGKSGGGSKAIVGKSGKSKAIEGKSGGSMDPDASKDLNNDASKDASKDPAAKSNDGTDFANLE